MGFPGLCMSCEGGIDSFYSKLSLQGCLYTPWKRECLPPERRKAGFYPEDTGSPQTLPKQRTGMLTARHERFGFPQLRVPPLQRSSLCIQVSIFRFSLHYLADTLATGIAVSDKLPFVFDPRDSCLLPASTKLWPL